MSRVWDSFECAGGRDFQINPLIYIPWSGILYFSSILLFNVFVLVFSETPHCCIEVQRISQATNGFKWVTFNCLVNCCETCETPKNTYFYSVWTKIKVLYVVHMICSVIDCFTVKWCTLHCDSSKMPTYWCLHSFEPKTSKKGRESTDLARYEPDTDL